MSRVKKDFSLEDLKYRVLKDLGGAKSINERDKLYKTYQSILKQEESLAEDVKEQILVEEINLGDAIVEFVQGKTKKLTDMFEITRGPGTRINFELKKKADLESVTEAVCSLVDVMTRQHSFDELF